jgi:hypothetical protein
MAAQKDPGTVVWSERSNRWWSVCGSKFCQWKASHEEPATAVSAMRRHLITRHAVSEQPLDARQEPEH